MTVRKLDENYDYSLEKIDGRNEVVQCLTTKLNMWLGEWFLEVDSGTDYMSILTQRSDIIPASAAIFKRRILEVKQIERISEFEVTQEGRILRVSFSVVYNGEEYANLQIPLRV